VGASPEREAHRLDAGLLKAIAGVIESVVE
jgi:hypothetical protein